MTCGLIEDIPHDRWTWQQFPGQNHVSWIILHLTLADDWGPTSLGRPQKQFVERWESFMKAGPDANAGAWPKPETLLSMFNQAHEHFLGCFEGVTDEDLERRTSGPIAEYAPNLGTILDSHIWHEGFHGGQISVIRKALGLPPRFG